jgi:hypothetical protein
MLPIRAHLAQTARPQISQVERSSVGLRYPKLAVPLPVHRRKPTTKYVAPLRSAGSQIGMAQSG